MNMNKNSYSFLKTITEIILSVTVLFFYATKGYCYSANDPSGAKSKQVHEELVLAQERSSAQELVLAQLEKEQMSAVDDEREALDDEGFGQAQDDQEVSDEQEFGQAGDSQETMAEEELDQTDESQETMAEEELDQIEGSQEAVLEEGFDQSEESPEVLSEEMYAHEDSHLLHREQGIMLADDLRLGIGATFVFQAAHNANGDSLNAVGEDVDDTSYSVDVELEKTISDSGILFAALEVLGGEGVEDELKTYSNVNYDAGKNGRVRLAEGWYEHYLDEFSFTVTLGKLDATNYIDTNEYANNETTQFLGRMFVNSPTIEFGDNAMGARLGWQPNDTLAIDVLAMDVNSDFEHLFSERFFGTQLTVKSSLFERNGALRLFGWLNDRDHTTWLDATQTEEKGFGCGLNFDHEITDFLGVFFRYGWQDPEVFLNGSGASLEQAMSAGIQLDGGLWSREEDTLGFAYGHIFPSEDYQDAQRVAAKSENHVELYYNFKVTDYFTLTPDVQAVWRPFGRDAVNGSEAITTYAIRGQLSF